MSPELEHKLKNLPESPGVYIMLVRGQVVYVGKAKNLKHRVRSYFQDVWKLTVKVAALVEKVDDFNIILCDTELEALVLESNLIKKHQPHYNILLKDDKHFPYVKVAVQEPYPRLSVVRRTERDGARYFGPYRGAWAVRRSVDIARELFPMRTCNRAMEGSARPCIQHEMGRCPAPCDSRTTPEAYAETVRGLLRFLGGQHEELLTALTRDMTQAAQAMQFEKAARLRDAAAAIRELDEEQKVERARGEDHDALGLAQEGSDAVVQMMSVRGGKLIGSEHYLLRCAGDDLPGELLQGFVLQYYDETADVPPTILLPCQTPDQVIVSELLADKRGARVALRVPERGEKRALIIMAEKNARDVLAKHRLRRDRAETTAAAAMQELKDALGLDVLPRRIEGFDISNTQGTLSVASMVVFENGAPKKSDYRRFRIQTVQGANDFASMHEIVGRRFKHLAEGDARFGARPDVVLIDGGPAQLDKALSAMRTCGIEVPMFGLSERLEAIHLEGREDAIILSRNSDALHLIQRVRDEAHRFAITFHRSRRGKESVASRLEQIPGVGPKRRAAMLKHFKSAEKLREAAEEELAEVVDKKTAAAVYAYYHPHETKTADKGETKA